MTPDAPDVIMSPGEIISKAEGDGVRLQLSPAGTIKVTGEPAAVNRWLPVIRERKPAIVAWLRECEPRDLLWHPDIPGDLVADDPLPRLPRRLGGYGTSPGVPPLGACELARQIRSMPEDDHVPGDVGLPRPDAEFKARLLATVARIQEEEHNAEMADLARVRALHEALARPDPPVVSPEFAARLSPEDREDLLAGDVPPETFQAFEAAAVAREAEDLKEYFEERSAILEHDAGLPGSQAEFEAACITSTYARNRGYSWAALRSALAGYPELLAQVPDRPGLVDALVLGLPTVAVCKDGRVLKQGTFRGAPEVKG